MKTVLMAMLLMAAPVFSQAPSQGPSGLPPGASDQMQSRYQISVMEAVLESAVQHGAQIVGRRIQSLTPNLLVFAGPAQARGFRLDGYGVFFDVELPALPRGLTWSFRTLNEMDSGIGGVVRSLKQHVRAIQDARARAEVEQALKLLELQVGPLPPEPASDARVSTASTAAAATPEASRSVPSPVVPIIGDPVEAYLVQVKEALVDAMLDHSGPIGIGSNEWLTVAARESGDRVIPGEIYDSVTILLRIRGSDLASFRADRLNKEEARRRVEVREF